MSQNPKTLDYLQREDAATFVYKTVTNLSGSFPFKFGVTESFAPNRAKPGTSRLAWFSRLAVVTVQHRWEKTPSFRSFYAYNVSTQSGHYLCLVFASNRLSLYPSQAVPAG